MTPKALKDIPADAGLLRAIAVDVEDDRGYAFGRITAARLRRLAERLEQPLTRAFMVLLDKMELHRSQPATIEVRFVEQPSGEADVVLDLADGVRLVSNFGFVRTSEHGATPGER